MRLAVALRASDIHLGPLSQPDGTAVGVIRFRIDGVMKDVARFDCRLVNGLAEQWKRMAACDPQDRQRSQDGRYMTGPDWDGLAGGGALDLRLCFVPLVMGESLTIRVLDRSAVVLDLDRMDLPQPERRIIDETIGAPCGLVLVVGPTGSGKTTLLYSCLMRAAGPGVKVMSVEDPVEFLLPYVDQVQVNPGAGLTFTRAIRAMLRSAAEALLVCEIRDSETLQLTLQASLTGLLVFSTLHTDEAVQTLKRMVDMGADPFVVADATRTIMATRLVRKLCPACSVSAKSGQFLERAERMARGGGVDWDAMPRDFRDPAPAGCDKCARTGYRGRQLLIETLRVTPEIGAALRRGASVDELRHIAVSEGMTTLPAGGVRLAGQGITSLSEIIRVWRT